ncbi:MAG: sigma 54-interacting transcriptional regulator [Myxococcales bacterium]|nr:sigma 54-interacting transcriptional regulator [Myxococcales bacterium]
MRHTAPDSQWSGVGDDEPAPGLLVVWSGDAPALQPFRLPPAGLVLGRELLADGRDDRISRLHARVRPGAAGFSVTDLGSRNGTHVAGRQVHDGEVAAVAGDVLRAGRTLALLCADIRPFEGTRVVTEGDAIAGPALQVAWRAAERAARTGETLLLTGESGSGKELAAAAFHRAATRDGAAAPLVAVNCAAIPATVAERLLFGTRRGAYSGADRDADGYLAAADGGTIFLDEIGELELGVQAKLLRVLETGELLPLGAARPQPVRFKTVAATLRDLRGEVAARRFRDDLYYRIGRPELTIPPLRARREEIGYHVASVAAAAGVAVHPTVVELCLRRPWPGNVRELRREVRHAALAAREDGRSELRAEHLDPRAGQALDTDAGAPAGAERAERDDAEAGRGAAPLPDLATVDAALAAHGGNVSAAARALGLHRNQIRRLLAKRRPDGADGGEDAGGDA